MKTILLLVILMLNLSSFASHGADIPGNEPERNKVVISGKIKDAGNGEELIGASVYIKELQTGTATNLDGFFTLSLKPGNYSITISYVGYETQTVQLDLREKTVLDLNLVQQKHTLKEVVISDVRNNEAVTNNEMSVVKMKPEQIRSIPALMGEVDVIKAIQLLPGVQSSGEGFSGFSVRGGGADQNLIQLDDATIYSASHLMGFFSVFNFDAVRDVKLYKGDIPASHGGRLSSLLDIRQKDGNPKKFALSAGIGTISSRVMIEGPVVKDKSSFMLAARRSYADLFLPYAPDTNIRKNKLYFYDLNMKLNYTLNSKNRFYFSAYSGRDVYGFDKAVGTNWGNNTQTIRWNHIYSSKLYSNVSLVRSKYNYEMSLSEAIAGFKWFSGMEDVGLKADFGYSLNAKNTVKYGVSTIYHRFQPGRITPNGNPAIIEVKMPQNKALEHGLYMSNEQEISPLVSVEYGIRYSAFQNLGEGVVYNFDENHESIDSTVYRSCTIFNTNAGLEPRIGMKYLLSETASVKASYSRTRQYVHLASNSQGGTPLDIWFPTNKNVKPQLADQLAIGYYKSLHHNKIEASVEVYYKELQNQVDFKDNAILVMNPKLDGELRVGRGRAYGAEFLLRKQEGRLNGWISYTLSRSERRLPDINNNEYYPSNNDKPHNLSVVLNYVASDRVSLSANWVYTSGTLLTMPSGKYEYGNMIVPVYSGRNGYRLPDYHRLDLSVTLKGKEKPGRRFSGEWNFSIYNAYYRKNAFSISFERDKENPSQMVAYKVYLFPIIPALTYNVKF